MNFIILFESAAQWAIVCERKTMRGGSIAIAKLHFFAFHPSSHYRMQERFPKEMAIL
jgi:hypothetical protein